MLWKGPNGPETLLICKIHNHIAYWPTLGPFRYPRGTQKGKFGLKLSLAGRNKHVDPMMLWKSPNGPETCLTYTIHN